MNIIEKLAGKPAGESCPYYSFACGSFGCDNGHSCGNYHVPVELGCGRSFYRSCYHELLVCLWYQLGLVLL